MPEGSCLILQDNGSLTIEALKERSRESSWGFSEPNQSMMGEIPQSVGDGFTSPYRKSVTCEIIKKEDIKRFKLMWFGSFCVLLVYKEKLQACGRWGGNFSYFYELALHGVCFY